MGAKTIPPNPKPTHILTRQPYLSYLLSQHRKTKTHTTFKWNRQFNRKTSHLASVSAQTLDKPCIPHLENVLSRCGLFPSYILSCHLSPLYWVSQSIRAPASMFRSCPVILLESSEARKTANLATSSADIKELSGDCERNLCLITSLDTPSFSAT